MAAIGIIIITTMTTLIMSFSLVASPSGVGDGVGAIHIMAIIPPTGTHTVTMAAVITVPGMGATDTVIDQESPDCSGSSLMRDTIMVPLTESWGLARDEHCTLTSAIIIEWVPTVELIVGLSQQ